MPRKRLHVFIESDLMDKVDRRAKRERKRGVQGERGGHWDTCEISDKPAASLAAICARSSDKPPSKCMIATRS